MRTASYRTYSTHIVIYIPVFVMYEDTALFLGLCEASDFIVCLKPVCLE